MLVRNKIRTMESGSVLHVCASDPTTQRDLENFCRFMGHEIIRVVQSANRPSAPTGQGTAGEQGLASQHNDSEEARPSELHQQWQFWIRKA